MERTVAGFLSGSCHVRKTCQAAVAAGQGVISFVLYLTWFPIYKLRRRHVFRRGTALLVGAPLSLRRLFSLLECSSSGDSSPIVIPVRQPNTRAGRGGGMSERESVHRCTALPSVLVPQMCITPHPSVSTTKRTDVSGLKNKPEAQDQNANCETECDAR